MYQERESNSPHIQLVWRANPDSDGEYLHSASEYWSFFCKVENGVASVSLSGPATETRSLEYMAGGEYLGIVCRSHIFLPSVAKKDILDLNVELPMVDAKTFVLNGNAVAVPTYESAETFIDLLVQKHDVIADLLVAKALKGKTSMSKRSTQRHVLFTTGITQRKALRIQQARKAFTLLQEGGTITDVALEAGYADQSHLTKSLKLLSGQTPGEVLADHHNQ